MLEELAAGGVYMKMPYPPSRKNKMLDAVSSKYLNLDGLNWNPALSRGVATGGNLPAGCFGRRNA